MKLEQLLIGAAAAAALVITSPAAPGVAMSPGGATSPGGFTSPGVDHQFPAITQSQRGTTVGSWILPGGPGDPGLTVGLWHQIGTGGPPQFLMAATLEETPIFPPPLAFITGTLKGDLAPFPLTPLPSGMQLFGTWAAQTLTGSGSFQAVVVAPSPPGFLAPVLLIGKVQGVFEDGFGIGAVGSHGGFWSLSS